MSIFLPSTLGAQDNQITFNNRGSIPYFRMTKRAPTKRELVEFDIKLPEGLGVDDFETLIGKEYFLLTGKMYPKSETSFNLGRRMLRKVSSLVLEQADPFSDEGYVPYTWVEDGVGKQIFTKVEYVDIPEDSRNGLKQPFNIVCKIKYPVIFSTQQVVANLGSGNASTSSGIGYPFYYPVLYGASTYQSSGSLVNAGDMSTWPNSITIYGPINTPAITNTTTGQYIKFAVNVPAGHSLNISYNEDDYSATIDGNSVWNTLTSDSNLFMLAVGNNNLILSGSSIGTGAYAVVTALSAWPLS